MSLSLYQRIALSLTLAFSVILYLSFLWSSQLQQSTQLESEQRLHLGLAEHLVTDNPLLAEGVYDYDGLKNLFHTLMMLGPSFEFYYLDPNGKVLTYSAEPGKVKRELVNVAPIQSLLSNQVELPVLGDDPRNLEKQKIFSASPVYKEGVLQGYLYMIIGGEIHDSIVKSVQDSHSLKDVSIVIVASLGVLLVLLLGLFKSFTAPLNKMATAIKAIDQNNLSQVEIDFSVSKDSNNEINVLASAFNSLIKQVQSQLVQLENIDEHRRVLLADLSHDLRTPLANLQGYIETLSIHGGKLSEQERQKFVDISMRNANNLKRLIDQIFELAYLDGGQVTVHHEPFPLADLLFDVTAKFELNATKKGVRLEVEPLVANYLVFADIGKLERVLTNLIENAIRHTQENGVITLSVNMLKEQKNQLRIDIRDTGTGINRNEIAHIFDARYRASNAQEDKSTHVGLGLAISQKLVALLNSELKVESELGKGTCFSFSLPLANS
ncbi:two-component sensor histidine kinase [Psychrosphaera saromensis]|uniref:histidine kinase n=1 Tax=Psychrosphaera saromensis TaxID=716813 RepID=A0A2S7URU1_9GAMM|nr:HAMP domain-containing sensor histidine kinase [Psychrosphaera saromensis]PQJ52663.1 two-component sensor histidine kinase [Psychrosphaera saromensis]GHB70324.1 two-component sensor histidine kinase [Psychrosphaera saromensis]GLQ13146.1 two-component sensor histidine kinase [Psychrosphaera saromensis]